MSKKYFTLMIVALCATTSFAQKIPQSPCGTDPVYRQFDFWIGEWEAYNLQGKKSGDSKISLILDSCIVLEEWTSVPIPGIFEYKGKSFNTYNAASKQWQQSWVDNVGGSTNYTLGKFDENKIIFQTEPFQFLKDTMAIMRLTFFNVGKDEVRQFAEISKDNGTTWAVQYDLDYRRKK